MSASGHERTSRDVRVMSVIPLKADMFSVAAWAAPLLLPPKLAMPIPLIDRRRAQCAYSRTNASIFAAVYPSIYGELVRGALFDLFYTP